MPVRHRLLVTATLAIVVAACGSPSASRLAPTPADDATGSPRVTVAPSTAVGTPPTERPSLTPVPGGVTPRPVPTATRIPTTMTDWGTILDRLPDGFPTHPEADPVEPDEAASGAFLAATDPATAAAWYERALGRDGGFAFVELGSPLEDGTIVLNASTDIPECRVRMTFRPAGKSTMIIVLYGAACVGGPQ